MSDVYFKWIFLIVWCIFVYFNFLFGFLQRWKGVFTDYWILYWCWLFRGLKTSYWISPWLSLSLKPLCFTVYVKICSLQFLFIFIVHYCFLIYSRVNQFMRLCFCLTSKKCLLYGQVKDLRKDLVLNINLERIFISRLERRQSKFFLLIKVEA